MMKWLNPVLTFLSPYKWAILAGILGVSHFWVWHWGRESLLEGQAKATQRAVEKALEVERQAAKDAVARAEKDARELTELRSDNEELLKRVENLESECVVHDDSDILHILRDIAGKTIGSSDTGQRSE